MRLTLSRILLNLLSVAIIAIGMTLLIKANLGQSTVSGFSSTLAHILSVKTGTIVFFLNLVCFILELIILKKNVQWSIGLQLLQYKAGSKSELREFRRAVKAIQDDNSLPEYRLTIDQDDKVTFFARRSAGALPPMPPTSPKT